jgi:hypothetical protein
MQSESPHAFGRLDGVVDRFVRPRTLKGWVVNNERRCGGRDIIVWAHLDGRLIGTGRLASERPDVVDERGYLAGFQMVCSEDIPDEAIAFGRLAVTAQDPRGVAGTLRIYDRERSIALAMLLRSAPALERDNVATLLSVLSAKAQRTCSPCETDISRPRPLRRPRWRARKIRRPRPIGA